MKTLIVCGLFYAATSFAQTEIISDDIRISGDDDFEATLLDNTSHSFKAAKIITTEGNITVAKDVTVHFRAGEKIVLKAGFKAKAGSYFHAEIGEVKIPAILLADEPKAEALPRESAAVEENIPINAAKEDAMLLGSYPNPSNGAATIEYRVLSAQPVTITITDTYGRKLAEIVGDNNHPAGVFKAGFDRTDITAGTYFYTLRTPTHSETLKLVIMK